MRILVTGGAGFIGCHGTDALRKAGHKVAVVDNLSTGKKEQVAKKAKLYIMDVRTNDITSVFEKEKPQAVFHLAAQISVPGSVKNPLHDADHNIIGSLNVLEQARRHNVKKFIFASSGGALYGEAKTLPTSEDYLSQNPSCSCLSPYGVSKLTVENYLKHYHALYNLSFASLRFGNMYGPRQDSQGEAGVVAIFIANLLHGLPATIYGDGNQTRDFVYVGDVTRACCLTLQEKSQGFYNIGTGKETSVNELYEKIAKLTRVSSSPLYVKERSGDVRRSALDIGKIKRQLGWQPKISLDQGLKETIEWFKKYSIG